MISNFVNKSSRNLPYAQYKLKNKDSNELLENSRRQLVKNCPSSITQKQSNSSKIIDQKIPLFENKSNYEENQPYSYHNYKSLCNSEATIAGSIFTESNNQFFSRSKKIVETMKNKRIKTDYVELSHKAGIYCNKSLDRKAKFFDLKAKFKNKRIVTENLDAINKIENVKDEFSQRSSFKKLDLSDNRQRKNSENLSLIEKNDSKKKIRKQSSEKIAIKYHKNYSKNQSRMQSNLVSLKESIIGEDPNELSQGSQNVDEISRKQNHDNKIKENFSNKNDQNHFVNRKRSSSLGELTNGSYENFWNNLKDKLSYKDKNSNKKNYFKEKFKGENSASITNNAIIINTGNSDNSNQKIVINNKVIRNSSKKLSKNNEIIINNTIIINDVDNSQDQNYEKSISNNSKNNEDVIENDKKQIDKKNEFQVKNVEIFRSRKNDDLQQRNLNKKNLENKLYNQKSTDKRPLNYSEKAGNINDNHIYEQLLKNIPKRKIVTYGMHIGSCQQSVIGSYQQSYPYFHSKDIDIAGYQQKSNELYNTFLIFTNEIYSFLPNSIQEFTRQVDNVMINKSMHTKRKKKVKQTQDFYSLYTIEAQPEILKAIEKPIKLDRDQKQKQKLIIKDLIQEKILQGCTNSLFMEECDVQSILSNDRRIKFFYRAAIDYYILGEFEKAIPFLIEVLKINPHDGPSLEMYSFILENNYEAPDDWHGFRNIRSKLQKIKDI